MLETKPSSKDLSPKSEHVSVYVDEFIKSEVETANRTSKKIDIIGVDYYNNFSKNEKSTKD
jgi:hypothetical protein